MSILRFQPIRGRRARRFPIDEKPTILFQKKPARLDQENDRTDVQHGESGLRRRLVELLRGSREQKRGMCLVQTGLAWLRHWRPARSVTLSLLLQAFCPLRRRLGATSGTAGKPALPPLFPPPLVLGSGGGLYPFLLQASPPNPSHRLLSCCPSTPLAASAVSAASRFLCLHLLCHPFHSLLTPLTGNHLLRASASVVYPPLLT
jgi:hypothetical protein